MTDSLALQPNGKRGYRHYRLDRSPVIRLLIALLFALCLIFVLHYRQVRLEVLELNAVAENYLVAQVDFEYPDHERTVIQQQEALRDVGQIYRLNSKEITERQASFERHLSENQEWRDIVFHTTFEEMYEGIDRLGIALAESRFTDPRTLKRMRVLGLSTTDFFVYTPADSGQPIVFPKEIWNEIADEAFTDSDLNPAAMEVIVAAFAEASWVVEEDVAAVQEIRTLIKGSIPPVITQVRAGSRIIDKGERVTAAHVPMLQAMNEVLSRQRDLWHPWTILGSVLLTLLFVFLAALYLRHLHPKVYQSNKQLFLLLLILIGTFFLAKVTEYFLIRAPSNLADVIRAPLFVPFAAILVYALIDVSIAAVIAAFLSVVLALTLAVDSVEFLVLNLLSSVGAMVGRGGLKQRKEVFWLCVRAWLCSVVIIVSFHLYDNNFLQWSTLTDVITSFVFLVVTAVLVVGLLPILESLFRIVTGITLIEHMDPTHPLLRRLSIEAPGTYQHSIVVGNIAEAAALAIHANGLFCRAATLYHDIGKLVNPQYFTENQLGGVSPHQLLTPLESAEAIMAHVPDGVQIAKKHNIPEPFIDIIREHHGTTLVFYFYHKACEHAEQEAIDPLQFRYHGPKPQSKESAIIMISDTIEAASRSMDEPNEEAVRELVDRLVRDKENDGQFEECSLTFRELTLVKASIVTSVVNARHTRIKYPTTMVAGGTADDPALPDEDRF